MSRCVRVSIAGSNCPPADFGFGMSEIGLFLPPLEVAPVQKTMSPLRCTSAIATLALPTGLPRYRSRIKVAPSFNTFNLRFRTLAP